MSFSVWQFHFCFQGICVNKRVPNVLYGQQANAIQKQKKIMQLIVGFKIHCNVGLSFLGIVTTWVDIFLFITQDYNSINHF